MKTDSRCSRRGHEAEFAAHALRPPRPIGGSIAAMGVYLATVLSAAEPNAFLNLSARGRVDRGENILIGGLVVEHTVNVLLRGAGPSLAAHGVAEPVPHPRLTLFNRDGVALFSNTAWRGAIPAWSDAHGVQAYDEASGPEATVLAVTQQTGAFAFASPDDAALYVELTPGSYTVHLAADDDVPGVGLAEVYLVPEAIDPFAPAWRVRQSPDDNYTPTRAGFAPIAVVDETSGRTLRLDFESVFQWNLPVGASPASLTASSVEFTWVSTGTPDLRRGRAGVVDSRSWLIAPRYTKNAANAASIACLTTIDAQGTVIREEAALTFTAPDSGTFTYQWGTDDSASDRIGAVSGQSHGTFRWSRHPTLTGGTPSATSRFFRVWPKTYPDTRAIAHWAVGVEDYGPVVRHGDGPDDSDINGAREAIVTDMGGGQYVMHYDGCSAIGWRACQAVSTDLIHWQKNGPILQLGAPAAIDSAAACSPWMTEDDGAWHMFYFATPVRTPAPDLIPANPYSTRKAIGASPLGPWTKQPDVIPFDVAAGTYYEAAASPGHIIRHAGEFLQFISVGRATTAAPPERTLGLARTTDLNGAWTLGAQPLLPGDEEIENSSLYFEAANNLWFLFTNHVGADIMHGEYADAVWVYWSPDPTQWNPAHKAIVLDATSSSWSKAVIGMPSVVPVGGQLALFYDGNDRRDFGHMRRDIGLALLDLPLLPPNSL